MDNKKKALLTLATKCDVSLAFRKLKTGMYARYIPMTDEIVINKKIVSKLPVEYLEYILKHQLVHSEMKKMGMPNDGHGDNFDMMFERLFQFSWIDAEKIDDDIHIILKSKQ